jgi:hypothetical protein
LSEAEERYRNLILALDDQAREGPRLFTIALLGHRSPLGAVMNHRIQVSLWCEHSRLPVHLLNRDGGPTGMYLVDVPREWLVRAAPWIKATTMIVRALLPVGLLALGAGVSTIAIDAVKSALLASEKALDELAASDGVARDELPAGNAAAPRPTVDDSLLRTLHAFLRQRDRPSAGWRGYAPATVIYGSTPSSSRCTASSYPRSPWTEARLATRTLVDKADGRTGASQRDLPGLAGVDTCLNRRVRPSRSRSVRHRSPRRGADLPSDGMSPPDRRTLTPYPI